MCVLCGCVCEYWNDVYSCVCRCVCFVDVCVNMGMMYTPGRDTGDEPQVCVCV